jgi:glycopeptide antibiotics resistance protein
VSGVRRLGLGAAVLLALVLGALLLWPDGEAVRRVVLDVYLFFLERGVPPSVTPEVYATALNVLAFVPLGVIGVAGLRRRVLTTVLVLAGVSALVEAAQLLPALHREASLLDLACNTAGALVGALLGSALRDDARVDQRPDEAGDVGADDRR